MLSIFSAGDFGTERVVTSSRFFLAAMKALLTAFLATFIRASLAFYFS
jgi:hypothetical protein